MYRNRKTIIYILFVIGLLVLRYYVIYGFPYFIEEQLKYQVITSIVIMYIIILFWKHTLHSRVSHLEMYRYIRYFPYLCLIIMISKDLKYNYIHNQNIEYYCWYLYYIPLLFAPVLCLFASFESKIGERKINKNLHYLFLIPTGLSLLVLTNNYHQIVFHFTDSVEVGSIVNYEHNEMYTYGIGYYLIMSTIIIFTIWFLVNLYKQSHFLKGKINIIYPIIWILLLSGLLLVKIFYSFILNVPDMFFFLIIGVVELCIQYGLIITNNGYDEFFTKSTLSVKIVDANNQMIYQTNSYSNQRESYEIEKSYPIDGGKVVWVEDIGDIQIIEQNLHTIRESYIRENDLIFAENALTEKNALINTLNQFYDQIEVALASQYEKIEELLEIGDRESLLKILVYYAYIKRYGNLCILYTENKQLAFFELENGIREVLSYLELSHILTSCNGHIECMVDGQELIDTFVKLGDIIRISYSSSKAVMVNLEEKEKEIMIHVIIECDQYEYPVESYYEDDTTYFNFTIKKGVEL